MTITQAEREELRARHGNADKSAENAPHTLSGQNSIWVRIHGFQAHEDRGRLLDALTAADQRIAELEAENKAWRKATSAFLRGESYAGLSTTGINIVGDRASIDRVKKALHSAAQIEQWRTEFDQRHDADRERFAKWMLEHSLATGHGDTIDDLLAEASAQLRDRHEADARRIEELEKQIIFGFYEEEFPSYSQGPQQSEIQDLMTAVEANGMAKTIHENAAELSRLRAENEKLREALEPFGKEADRYDPDEGDSSDYLWDGSTAASVLRIGHLRRARAALASVEQEKGNG